MTSKKFLELLSYEIDRIEYKGKYLSIDKDVSSPEKIKFIWGKKQKTIYPNWDNPKEDTVIKKAVEAWIEGFQK